MSESPLDLIFIGSAGRHHVQAHTKALFTRMCEHAETFIQKARTSHPGKPIRLISGGAPWADHLAVKLFLDRAADALVLHLPAEFNRNSLEFEAPPNHNPKAARTLNQLHHQFSLATDVDSRVEIDAALFQGAQAYIYNGFFRRNDAVAAHPGLLAAYTFFEPSGLYTPDQTEYRTAKAAGLHGGGTAYTWDQAQGVAFKLHQSLVHLS